MVYIYKYREREREFYFLVIVHLETIDPRDTIVHEGGFDWPLTEGSTKSMVHSTKPPDGLSKISYRYINILCNF